MLDSLRASPAPPLRAALLVMLLGCGSPSPPADLTPPSPPPPNLDAPFAVAIRSDEVVRRLTAFLYRGEPDAGLRAMTAGRDLSISSGVADLAREMLRDPRAAPRANCPGTSPT